MSKHKPNRPDAPESWDQMIEELKGIRPPKLPNDATADDIAEYRDILCKMAEIIDGTIFDIGLVLSQHINGLDLNLFEKRLEGSLEGMALFEIEQAIERAELEAA
jgi:hypothetical protein